MNKDAEISHISIQNGFKNVISEKSDENYQLMDEKRDLLVAKISHQGSAVSRFYAGASIGPIAYLGYMLRDQTPKYRMILAPCVPLIYLRFKRYEVNRV